MKTPVRKYKSLWRHLPTSVVIEHV